VLAALAARESSLAVVETFTAGQIAARIAHLPDAEKVFRRGLVARDRAELSATLGLNGPLISGEMSRETAERVAQAMCQETGASHALAVLIEVDDGPDRIDFGGSIHLAIGGRVPPLAHLWRPQLGATGCGRTRPRLPAPLPAGPAGHRAHRFRAGVIPIVPFASAKR
jgi:Competence-damaged protein